MISSPSREKRKMDVMLGDVVVRFVTGPPWLKLSDGGLHQKMVGLSRLCRGVLVRLTTFSTGLLTIFL